MRKEVRGVSVRTTADIVDEIADEACCQELKRHQRGEVAVRLLAGAVDDCNFGSSVLQLGRDVLTDFEGANANVRPDRCDDLAGIGIKGFDRFRNDACDRAAPAGMHGGDVSCRRVREEDGHAVGRASSHRLARPPRDQRVTFSF